MVSGEDSVAHGDCLADLASDLNIVPASDPHFDIF